MTELEQFEQVWNGHFHKSKFWGGKYYSKRGAAMKERYENILFSIWKHHSDWDKHKGFQIKSTSRTIYRVVDLAEQAGLLVKIGNYSVGRFTRQYHKNCALFDQVFINQNDNPYQTWLNNNDNSNDIIYQTLRIAVANTKNISSPVLSNSTKIVNNKKVPNIDPEIEKSLIKLNKKLNYDLVKLHILSAKMLPHYYNLMEKLNSSVVHDDLKFISWLRFTDKHLPTGRPYSYFCSTLNREKKHRIINPGMEYRDDFLKRIGLHDYKEIYDIKSEIPRINHLFHSGEWKDDNYDFYTEIINDAQNRIPDPDGDTISRGKAGDENYDDSMKQMFMRIYFGRGSEKQSYLGYKQGHFERNKQTYENMKTLFKTVDDELFYPYSFDEWYELCCSTEKICGKSIGPLVFWYAFFIETEVKIELLKRGKKVYNVYDGFYFNQDISDEIRDILKEKAELVYKNYMIKIKL